MENAGAGAVNLLLKQGYEPRSLVVIACGPGNNGGDGLVVARHLELAGFRTRSLFPPLRNGVPGSRDARIQFEICRAMGLEVREIPTGSRAEELRGELEGADFLVDALFGTGLDRAIEGPAAQLVEALNGAESDVVALDIPSGLDCDTGRPLGPCVRARHTVTFVAPKIGFTTPGAEAYTGSVHVVGIGAPLEWPPEGR